MRLFILSVFLFCYGCSAEKKRVTPNDRSITINGVEYESITDMLKKTHQRSLERARKRLNGS